MKIRYYLRGLGIGILVTSIFFLVSNGNANQTMTDEQVKARARELGMTESMVLADLAVKETTEEAVEEIVESIVEEDTVEAGTLEESTIEESATEETTTVKEEESVSEEEASVPEEESLEEMSEEEPSSEAGENEPVKEAEEEAGSAPNTEPVTIMVNRGEGSDTVSRRLQEAGLVADAHEYDRYLMANGYDKKIGAGEHVIPAGATWEVIARTLCNMQ